MRQCRLRGPYIINLYKKTQLTIFVFVYIVSSDQKKKKVYCFLLKKKKVLLQELIGDLAFLVLPFLVLAVPLSTSKSDT